MAHSFAWHDGMLLGHGPMDAVHEEFVVLVDALLHAADADVPAALASLVRHTQAHFDDEKLWMTETAFPGRECHVAEHEAVLRSLGGVSRRVDAGDLNAARRLARALADWFPGHAEYLDAALAHWLCKLRLGGKPVVLRRHPPLPGAPFAATTPTQTPSIG